MTKWLKAAYCQTLLRVHQCALSDRITEYLFRECIKTHDYRHLGLSVCFSILKMNRFFYVTFVMRNSSMYFSIITMFSYIYKHRPVLLSYIPANLFAVKRKTFFFNWFISAQCKASLQYYADMQFWFSAHAQYLLKTNAASIPICLAHLYKAPNCKQSVIMDYILGMGHNSPTTI